MKFGVVLVLLTSLGFAVRGQDMKQILASLQSTIDIMSTTVPPRGFPFPKVPGPKSLESRIAIIGAGAAGIHMAYKLQNRGYKNIVVLEKSNRVGGKCWSVRYRGVVHEIGASTIRNENTEIRQLVEDFNVGPLLPSVDESLWTDAYTDLSARVYFVKKAAKNKTDSSRMVFLNLLEAIRKYITIHRGLFGDYSAQLMRRPHRRILRLVKGTVQDFLSRNDLAILESVFDVVFTAKGYGYLNETSALYGLMWVNPRLLINVVHSFLYPNHGTSILQKGLSALWEEIVSQRNITVRFSQTISQIIRTPNHISIIYNNPNSMSPSRVETYDFLIISSSMDGMLNILDTNTIERLLFSQLTPSFFTVSLLDASYKTERRGSSPSSLYMFYVNSKRDHQVWLQRDSFAIINGIKGDNFTSSWYNGGDDGRNLQTITTVQHSMSFPSPSSIISTLVRFAADFSITQATEMLRHTWNYFPRFPTKAMESGILWDILEMQGQKNTWFIGSSVCHESLKGVLDYNNLLLQNFKINEKKTKM